MKRAVLKDVPVGKTWDLTALLEEDDELSVGREEGNRIQLGEGLPEEKTKEKHLFTISRQHATITYDRRFFIRDHSTNGTRINGKKISTEKGYLRDGDEILFGDYGPVLFKEVD